jgi:hypothetical protein
MVGRSRKVVQTKANDETHRLHQVSSQSEHS